MLIAGLMFAAALAAQGAETTKSDPTPPTTASPAAAKPPETPAEPKKVCVTEAQMGSHMKKRICATPEEWERRRIRDAAEISKMNDRTAACTGSAC
jgi:hypothetical protein